MSRRGWKLRKTGTAAQPGPLAPRQPLIHLSSDSESSSSLRGSSGPGLRWRQTQDSRWTRPAPGAPVLHHSGQETALLQPQFPSLEMGSSLWLPMQNSAPSGYHLLQEALRDSPARLRHPRTGRWSILCLPSCLLQQIGISSRAGLRSESFLCAWQHPAVSPARQRRGDIPRVNKCSFS